MNLAMLDILDKNTNAVNAILAIDLSSLKVVRQNALATEYFHQKDGGTHLKRLLGKDTKVSEFMQGVQEELGTQEKAVISDTTVTGKTGEELECHITFSYISDDNTHLFMKIHPIIDNKPYYLERFIHTRSRPAFTLNVNDNLSITQANEVFYKSFACNEESLKIIYRNLFVNLLAQDSRQDYEKQILDAVEEHDYSIVQIPIKTARGEVLWLYFNKKKLKQITEEGHQILFCLLVAQDDSIAEINFPFEYHPGDN